MVANCNRDFGNRNSLSQDLLYILGTAFGVVNGTSRFLWGYLMDIFGFKILMYVITIIEIVVSASLYFVAFSSVLYFISILLIAACIGGNFAVILPYFNTLFGLELGQKVYSISGNFIGVSSICGPIMTKFLISDKTGYLIAFYVSCALLIFKIVVLFFFNEETKYRITIPGDIPTDETNESKEQEESDVKIEEKN